MWKEQNVIDENPYYEEIENYAKEECFGDLENLMKSLNDYVDSREVQMKKIIAIFSLILLTACGGGSSGSSPISSASTTKVNVYIVSIGGDYNRHFTLAGIDQTGWTITNDHCETSANHVTCVNNSMANALTETWDQCYIDANINTSYTYANDLVRNGVCKYIYQFQVVIALILIYQ